MQLPDLKHLDRIIALCRKRGVESIEIDNIKITLGAQPAKTQRKKRTSTTKTDVEQYLAAPDQIDSDSPTPEELLFWSSAQGLTEEQASE